MPKARKSVSFVSGVSGADESVAETKLRIPTAARRFVVPWHAFLLLLYLKWDDVTVSPRGTMARALPLLVVLQTIYGRILALSVVREGKKKRRESGTRLSVLATLLSMALSGAAFFVFILFGAPMLSHLAETFLLATHFLLVFLQPMLVLFRLDVRKLLPVMELNRSHRVILSHPVLCTAAGTVLGTWLGVIPLPLDWDRPWQAWPVTLLVGMYAGTILGSASTVLSRHWRCEVLHTGT